MGRIGSQRQTARRRATSCARHKFLQPVRKPSQMGGEGFYLGPEFPMEMRRCLPVSTDTPSPLVSWNHRVFDAASSSVSGDRHTAALANQISFSGMASGVSVLAVTVDCDEKHRWSIENSPRAVREPTSRKSRALEHPWLLLCPTLSAGALSRVLDVGHPPTPVISYQRSKDSFR